MNIQRFTAATSREALAKARQAFGDGTLILSNRPTEHGVEVVATAEDSLAALDSAVGPSSGSSQGSHSGSQARPQSGAPRQSPPSYREVASKVEEDAEQLAMSTLSFQDYVRERMLRKRHASGSATSPVPASSSTPATAPTAASSAAPVQAHTGAPAVMHAALHAAMPAAAGPAPMPAPIRIAPTPAQISIAPAAPSTYAEPPKTPAPTINTVVMEELQAMKALMEDRFNTLTWLGQAKQNPIQSNLMLKLIRAGFSPSLSRAILERMPEDMDASTSTRWVMDVLERNLRTDANTPPIHEEGGVFALIGATGVGKTTTAAKLAGLCARIHGPSSVGLITLDTYRIGAHEQLRAYGKMLGVVAHLAHDKPALQDLLGLLANKKMVLVDTTGIAPRDERKRELLELLDIPGVKRLLVLNAGAQGDTLDEVITSYKSGNPQQAILSKTDEAVKLAPAVDACIRHQLLLRGTTTGQRVPEDWEAANAPALVRQALRSNGTSPYDPKATDLGFIFSQPVHTSTASHTTHKGYLDA